MKCQTNFRKEEGCPITYRNSRSESVQEQLKRLIAQNMKPGDRLPTEKTLAESFQVGRSTIRESLSALAVLGLVERRNGATFVAKTPPADCLADPLNLLISLRVGNVADLLELRELLELAVLPLAAKRATPEALRPLERIHWRMQDPDASREQFLQNDVAFHQALVAIAGNSVLTELYGALRKVIAENQTELSSVAAVQDDSIASHGVLLAALREHNVPKAMRCMQDQLRITRICHGLPPAPEGAPEANTTTQTGKEPSDASPRP